MFYDWDWPAAEREFKRAIELNPSHAGVHVPYGMYLSNFGRPKEGVAQLRRAQELDPLSPLVNLVLANRLRYLRQFDESIMLIERVLEWDPDHLIAYWLLSSIYHKKRMHEESWETIKKTFAFSGLDEAAEAMEQAYRSSGYEEAWRELATLMAELSKTRYMGPTYIAEMYIRANEKDKAIQWLETAYEQHDPNMIYLLAPDYDPLRSDPRFQDLVRRMDFPQ
jgi:predicted Zn-dependent protease